jgi:ABC transport system ATP-binding/permease protein
LRRDRINLSILLLQAPLLAGVLLLIAKPDVFEPYQSSRLHELGYLDSLATTVASGKIIVFLLTFFSLMCGVISSVREIVKELPIYRRERAVNLGVVPYILSKVLVLASVSALQTGIFIAIVFSQVRPPPGEEDFSSWVYLVLFATNLAGIALGLAVSAAVNNQNAAIATLPIVLLSQIVLSGALTSFRQESLKLLSNATIMKFGFQALGKLTRLWRILPGGGHGPLEPLVKTAREYHDQFDVDLGAQVEVLAGFVVVFVVVACVLQLRRDHTRD